MKIRSTRLGSDWRLCVLAAATLTVISGGAGCGDDPPKVVGDIFEPEGTLSVNQNVLDFGKFAPGEVSPVATFEVKNISGLPTGPVTVALDNTQDFELTSSDCGNPLASAGTCRLSVRFRPRAPGTKAATVRVTAAPGGAVSIQLLGTAPGPAVLFSNPEKYDFGRVPVVPAKDAPPSVPEKTFIIGNSGGMSAGTVGRVALAGPDAAEYVLRQQTCEGAVLGPDGGYCEVRVAFQPRSPGLKNAQITFEGITLGPIPVTGFGVGALLAFASPVPGANFPDTYAFRKSESREYRIENKGTADATSLRIQLSNSADFALDRADCGDKLSASASCVLRVSFTPKAVGLLKTTLSIEADAGVSLTVELSGTGRGESPASMKVIGTPTFGTVVVGQSESKLLRVESKGPVPIGPVTVSLLGPHMTDFEVQDDCPDSLAPDLACTVTVTFRPRAVQGVRSAFVQIMASPGGSITLPLMGQAVFSDNFLSASPTTRNFGEVTIGKASEPRVFTITYVGTGRSGALKVTVEGMDATDFAKPSGCEGMTLGDGETCSITLRFVPQNRGNNDGYKEASLIVSDGMGANGRSYLTGRAR